MPQPDHTRPTAPGLCLIDRSDRARIEITGPDRAKFLHNLTTNEVRRRSAGRGCEAFVTSPQGKTIGYVAILAAEDRILVRSDPGGMELALPHLKKYGMFDDVAIDDRSEATFELHLLGEGVDDLVRSAGGTPPDPPDYAHVPGELGGRPVRFIRESPAGVSGITILGERADAEAVASALAAAAGDATLARLEPAEFEALRIEAGTPAFGKDVTEKNLPQEFARDDRAISFVKGCYLGQETVARIDALGHVNQFLKGLMFEPGSPCPAPGTSLEADGKRVGAITSAADSPWRGHPVALAMVRAAHARAGTCLTVAVEGSDRSLLATVVDLPFPLRGGN
ncbi:MAG: CAF17-like 4Fe-4S cluster assembly/insertion protein YgfZ [Isosphaeraceae bacterium]